MDEQVSPLHFLLQVVTIVGFDILGSLTTVADVISWVIDVFNAKAFEMLLCFWEFEVSERLYVVLRPKYL